MRLNRFDPASADNRAGIADSGIGQRPHQEKTRGNYQAAARIRASASPLQARLTRGLPAARAHLAVRHRAAARGEDAGKQTGPALDQTRLTQRADNKDSTDQP